jgi:hypothetical protein
MPRGIWGSAPGLPNESATAQIFNIESFDHLFSGSVGSGAAADFEGDLTKRRVPALKYLLQEVPI